MCILLLADTVLAKQTGMMLKMWGGPSDKAKISSYTIQPLNKIYSVCASTRMGHRPAVLMEIGNAIVFKLSLRALRTASAHTRPAQRRRGNELNLTHNSVMLVY